MLRFQSRFSRYSIPLESLLQLTPVDVCVHARVSLFAFVCTGHACMLTEYAHVHVYFVCTISSICFEKRRPYKHHNTMDFENLLCVL